MAIPFLADPRNQKALEELLSDPKQPNTSLGRFLQSTKNWISSSLYWSGLTLGLGALAGYFTGGTEHIREATSQVLSTITLPSFIFGAIYDYSYFKFFPSKSIQDIKKENAEANIELVDDHKIFSISFCVLPIISATFAYISSSVIENVTHSGYDTNMLTTIGALSMFTRLVIRLVQGVHLQNRIAYRVSQSSSESV